MLFTVDLWKTLISEGCEQECMTYASKMFSEHYVGEKHSTAISSVLDDLKDDILYCQQSELKEIKGKLKTVSDIVSSGEEVYIEGRHGFTPASRSTALRNHSSSMWLEDVAEFDLAHLDLTHCTDTMFNRQGWFLLIIYLLTLLLNLWSAELDDMLMLYTQYKIFKDDRGELYNKLSQWHTLNVCRCIFAMLGWLVISITEPEDLLLQHLKAIKQFDVQPKDILLVSSPSSTARY
ncbi:hypothetical protein LSTR_LSTR000163 [Laodelphax striatellus]|uniref:Uncharacterized protein n=1 Tax=Laodelphax striatellus TaxID=195883 RepID=A0A482X6D5_LAOST|nr:hypothetical protein LSTR_LSTR000163 [Laodelphax striatellus]